MVHLRTLGLVGAACLTIGWVVASVVSPPVATTARRAQRVRQAPDAAVLAPVHERLRALEARAPDPPGSGRNPFLFGTGRRTGSAEPSRPAVEFRAVETPAAEEAPARGRLTLAGIATSTTADGPVRTAVLSDGAEVFLVKVGDAVAGYTVVRIDETAVVLADPSGREATLAPR